MMKRVSCLLVMLVLASGGAWAQAAIGVYLTDPGSGEQTDLGVADPVFIGADALQRALDAVNADAANGPGATVTIMEAGTYVGDVRVNQSGVTIAADGSLASKPVIQSDGAAPVEERWGVLRNATVAVGVDSAATTLEPGNVSASLALTGCVVESAAGLGASLEDGFSIVTVAPVTLTDVDVHGNASASADDFGRSAVEAFGSGALVTMDNCVLDGSSGSTYGANFIVTGTGADNEHVISNTVFTPAVAGGWVFLGDIWQPDPLTSASFTNCSFGNETIRAGEAVFGGDWTFEDCSFHYNFTLIDATTNNTMNALWRNCTFNGNGWSLGWIANGQTLTFENCVLDHNVHEDGHPDPRMMRVIGGTVNFIECELRDTFIDSWANRDFGEGIYGDGVNINLDSCHVYTPWRYENLSWNAAGDSTGRVTCSAVNTVFHGGATEGAGTRFFDICEVVFDAPYGVDLILDHCTFMGGSNHAFMIFHAGYVAGVDHTFSINNCVLDASLTGGGWWYAPEQSYGLAYHGDFIANGVAQMVGSNNVFWDSRIAPGNGSPFAICDRWPVAPGQIWGDPMLDANGVPGAGSIALGNAAGSTLTRDINGASRPDPSGEAPDCGAYEVASAAQFAPVPYQGTVKLEIPKLSAAPSVDGAIDAVWDEASWMNCYDNYEVLWDVAPATSDASARFKAGSYDGKLYVMIEVTDDYLNVDDVDDWQRDAAEVFIDLNRLGGAVNMGNQLAVWDNYGGPIHTRCNFDMGSINPSGAPVWPVSGDVANPITWATNYNSEATGDSYVGIYEVELTLPAGTVVDDYPSFGMGVQIIEVDDSADADPRKGVYGWFGGADPGGKALGDYNSLGILPATNAHYFAEAGFQDDIAPVISLNSANPYTLLTGEPWVDPMTASDNADGDLTGQVAITGTVDVNTPASYTLNYEVSDSSGNTTTASRTVIVTNDTDGDGMPDWWEELYGLDPNDPSDAHEDLDNDGSTNLEEYLNDTDPTDPSSRLPLAGMVGLGLLTGAMAAAAIRRRVRR